MRTGLVRGVIASALRRGEPLLLVGAPGVAKSSLAAQGAADAGIKHVIREYVVTGDPTDAQGLPAANEADRCMDFLPKRKLRQILDSTEPTLVLLEDFGQGSPSVQASWASLLQDRITANGDRIPDCVVFMATSNRRADRSGVQGILEMIKGRFAAVVEVEVSLEDWLADFAVPSGLFSAPHLAWLKHAESAGASMLIGPLAQDMEMSPSPRNHAHLAAWIADSTVPAAARAELYGQTIGKAAAASYLSFVSQYGAMCDVGAILADPDNAPLPGKPESLYAVTVGLAYRADTTTFPAIVTVATRLHAAARGQFARLLIEDTKHRVPVFESSPAYTALMASAHGRAFMGAV